MPDVYCNTTTDLLLEVPGLESYDRKERIEDWQLVSGTTYQSHDTGYVGALYRNGIDLGAPQASAAAVLTDGQWFYDSAADALTIVSTYDPNTYWAYAASGQDWPAMVTQATQRASAFVRSYVNKPIHHLPAADSPTGREWPEPVIMATAKWACSLLVGQRDPELKARLQAECIDRETRMGLLDMLKSGALALPDETTARLAAGVVISETVDEATTGTILDVHGKPSVDHDVVLVKIVEGGTLAKGTASPVTYSTWIRNSTGLQVEAEIVAETVTGGRDAIGHGMSVTFSPGVYVAGDAWEVEMNGDDIEAGETPSATILQMARS